MGRALNRIYKALCKFCVRLLSGLLRVDLLGCIGLAKRNCYRVHAAKHRNTARFGFGWSGGSGFRLCRVVKGPRYQVQLEESLNRLVYKGLMRAPERLLWGFYL